MLFAPWCERWKSTNGMGRCLNAFERKCLRKILHIKWNEFIYNKCQDLSESSTTSYLQSFPEKKMEISGTCVKNEVRSPLGSWNNTQRGWPKESLDQTLVREWKLMGLNNTENVQRAAQVDKDGSPLCPRWCLMAEEGFIFHCSSVVVGKIFCRSIWGRSERF